MTWLLVFTGGGLGAVARLAVARLFPVPPDDQLGFPWGTFSANLAACIVLGVALSLLARQQLPPAHQALVVTGFCGGFSTFSTFAADLLYLLQQGQLTTAIVYLTASILLGVGSILAVLYLTAVPAS